jgi:hypothetical protein
VFYPLSPKVSWDSGFSVNDGVYRASSNIETEAAVFPEAGNLAIQVFWR